MEKFIDVIVWLGQHKFLTTLMVLVILVGFGFRKPFLNKLKGGETGDGILDKKG